MLVTGRTIGDRVAGTLVMSEQNTESYNKELQNNSSETKKENIKGNIFISCPNNFNVFRLLFGSV
mgnify:CR=1 FL=1